MPEEPPDRFQIGHGGRGYLIVDAKTGWVMGWFPKEWDAQLAKLRLELGLHEPPNPENN